MRKIALLLGSTRGKEPLPMVKEDISLICNYLQSIRGGAWNSDEIKIGLDEKIDEVEEFIQKVNNIDRAEGNFEKYYSCNIDEVSNASQNGSYFTTELIKLAENYSLNSNEVISLYNSVCCLKKNSKELNKLKQNPRYSIPKSEKLFPFIVEV